MYIVYQRLHDVKANTTGPQLLGKLIVALRTDDYLD